MIIKKERQDYKNKKNFHKLLLLYLIHSFKNKIKKLFNAFNCTIISNSLYKQFLKDAKSVRDSNFLLHLKNKKLTKYLEESNSELRQDLFVLNELNFKKKGFFVEFGAGNGFDLSNTLLLENKFSWRGILSEPAKIFHQQLKKRKCNINTDALYLRDNLNLTFNENTFYPSLSTINKFSNSDGHFTTRLFNSKKYQVNTISLNSLLKKYNAPKIIDYLSIDTEGSEYEILNAFDFSSYQFRVITCEHNNTLNRNKIYKLLLKKGYVRKFINISAYDDWYVKKTIV
jgi:FkbM family methyltransferase